MDELNVLLGEYSDMVNPYFERFFQPVYDFNLKISEFTGVPPVNSIYLIALFVPLFLSFFFRLIPKSWYVVKHLYCTTFGLFMCGLLYKSETIIPIVSVYLGFFMLYVVPAKYNRYLTPLVMFTIMSVSNIHEMVYHYMEWRATFLIVQMILTFKLSSVAVNLHDFDKIHNNKPLRQGLRELVVEKKPTLIQYFSYAFFYGTITTGPSFEYVHYIEWIESEKSSPFDFHGILKRIGLAFLFLVIYIISDSHGIHTDLFTSEEYLNSHNAFYLLFMTSVVLFCMRAKYLFGWFFAESICIAAGFGYSGVDEDGNPKWEHIQQTDVTLLYTATSIRNALNSWNMGTSRWLRNYVYDRAPFASRTLQSLSAMTVSAIWHGFYPGYYFAWPVLAILVQIYIHGFKKLRPRVKNYMGWDESIPLWVTIPLIVILRLFGNYVVCSFHLYSYEFSVAYYSRFYWIPHALIFIVFLILVNLKPPKRSKKKD